MSNYKIGRGKPPKKTRFKKGKSGNPNGRPKGSQNFKTIVERQLSAPITIRENGKVRKISATEAVVMKLKAEAVGGSHRAMQYLLNLAEAVGADGPTTKPADFNALDLEIIRNFAPPLLTPKPEGEVVHEP